MSAASSSGVLTVTVDNRLRVRVADLPPGVLERLQREFTYDNPDRAKAERLAQTKPWLARRLPPEVLTTWRLDRGGELSLPRGGMNRLRRALFDAGVPYRAIDRRTRGEPVAMPAHRAEQWDFQRAIIAAGRRVEQGVVRSPTGSGKTTAAIGLIAEVPVRWLIVVWRKALFDQWVRRLREELGLADRDIGRIKGKTRRVGLVTVGMQQTLTTCAGDFADAFGGVCCDEVHKFAARTFLAVVDVLRARYRVGVSDDERRKDGKHFLIYDEFGDVIADVDRRALVEQGFIYDVELRVVPTEFRAPWYEELPDVQKADPELFGRLLEEMARDGARNRIAVEVAVEEALGGQPVLVFAHRHAHCHRLLADVAAEEPRAGLLFDAPEWGADFEATRNALAAGVLRVGVGTYQSIGTGIDLPSVSRGVCATPVHSNRPFFSQVRGRICRVDRSPGASKSDAQLYYLWDRRIFGLTSLRNIVRWSGRARVLDGGEWVDGREYVRRLEHAEEQHEQVDGFNVVGKR